MTPAPASSPTVRGPVLPGARSALVLLLLIGLFMGTVMTVMQLTVQRVAGTALLGAAAASIQLSRSVGAAVNERAIDVQVTRLRRKIEPDPSFPRYLRTVRGQGYRLVDA